MDQRVQARIPAYLEICVTEIRKGTSATGQVVDVSEGGLCILVDLALAPSDLVQLQVADTSLFGQVAWVAEDEQPLRIGVAVFQVLLGTSDLSRLMESVLTQTMPMTPGLSSAAIQP